jgi:hypothetical protein
MHDVLFVGKPDADFALMMIPITRGRRYGKGRTAIRDGPSSPTVGSGNNRDSAIRDPGNERGAQGLQPFFT